MENFDQQITKNKETKKKKEERKNSNKYKKESTRRTWPTGDTSK